MKKRVLAFLCVCALAAGAAAGCGSQAGTAGQEGSVQTTPEDAGTEAQTTPEVAGIDASEVQTTPEVAGIDMSVMKPWINTNIYGLVTDPGFSIEAVHCGGCGGTFDAMHVWDCACCGGE